MRGSYSEGTLSRQGVGKLPSGVWVLRGGKHPSGYGHGEEPVTGQEGISDGGQSPDDESGTVLEEIGNEGRGWSSNSA